VTDDGPGFEPAVIARGVTCGTSTGLGLDIARRMAEAGGGSMAIAGSSVTLRFGAP
jgi:signal transduction histidine kinase